MEVKEGRKEGRWAKVVPGQLSLELSGVTMNRGEVVVKQEVMLSGHRGHKVWGDRSQCWE